MVLVVLVWRMYLMNVGILTVVMMFMMFYVLEILMSKVMFS